MTGNICSEYSRLLGRDEVANADLPDGLVLQCFVSLMTEYNTNNFAFSMDMKFRLPHVELGRKRDGLPTPSTYQLVAWLSRTPAPEESTHSERRLGPD